MILVKSLKVFGKISKTFAIFLRCLAWLSSSSLTAPASDLSPPSSLIMDRSGSIHTQDCPSEKSRKLKLEIQVNLPNWSFWKLHLEKSVDDCTEAGRLLQVSSDRDGPDGGMGRTGELSTDLRFLGCAGVVRVPCVSLLGAAVPQVDCWASPTLPSAARPMSRGCPGSMHTAASTILLSSEPVT